MDPAYLTGVAIFAGSVVGGITSLVSALLTKKHEGRARIASEDKGGRQKLYTQFIEEASKLYLDALVRDQPESSAMVSLYALVSKMRIVSSANIVKSAEAVTQTVLCTYSLPNKTFGELRQLMLNKEFLDPLLTFSEVCRDDLRQLHLRERRPGRGRTAISGLLGASTQTVVA